MTRILTFILILIWTADVVRADSVVAARTLRAGHVIAPDDLALSDRSIPGASGSAADLVGRETAVAIYAAQPVRLADTRPPAIVERNALVVLVYAKGGLTIRAEGRALGRGAIGDVVQAMNLSSRTTVAGTVRPDGMVEVTR